MSQCRMPTPRPGQVLGLVDLFHVSFDIHMIMQDASKHNGPGPGIVLALKNIFHRP
jgi:hypothetical protein